jgi:hypothetical protein
VIIAEVNFRITRYPYGWELEIRSESLAGREFIVREQLPDTHLEPLWDHVCLRGCERLRRLMVGHEEKYGITSRPSPPA